MPICGLPVLEAVGTVKTAAVRAEVPVMLALFQLQFVVPQIWNRSAAMMVDEEPSGGTDVTQAKRGLLGCGGLGEQGGVEGVAGKTECAGRVGRIKRTDEAGDDDRGGHFASDRIHRDCRTAG